MNILKKNKIYKLLLFFIISTITIPKQKSEIDKQNFKDGVIDVDIIINRDENYRKNDNDDENYPDDDLNREPEDGELIYLDQIREDEEDIKKEKSDKLNRLEKFIKKIDGDTIIVNFNNKELKVRYLLIDTPETVKPGVEVQKYGPEASELNGKLLSNAKDVEIEFDAYEKEDKYHRALCYVYADGKNVQEELLLAGLAEIKYVKPPDTRYLNKFKKAQNKAKSNKRNLWSNS